MNDVRMTMGLNMKLIMESYCRNPFLFSAKSMRNHLTTKSNGNIWLNKFWFRIFHYTRNCKTALVLSQDSRQNVQHLFV